MTPKCRCWLIRMPAFSTVVSMCLALCFFFVGQFAYSAQAVGSLVPQIRAKVVAVRQTVLSSQMSGKIDHLSVRDGESFMAGQVLAKMDCAIPVAQLKRAEAASHKQSALFSATQKLARLNSRSQLDVSMTRAEAAQAAAEVAVARILVDHCEVIAPYAGRVAERLVQENQYVNEGQPLFEILDPTELELEFIISSAWLPWFQPGYAFTVHIDETQKEYNVVLKRLSGKVDAVSQSVKAYAVFINPDGLLLPGMSGEALLPAAHK